MNFGCIRGGSASFFGNFFVRQERMSERCIPPRIHPKFIHVCCHVVAGIRRKEEIYAKTKATKNKRNKLLNPFDTGRYLDG
jgi:hypothetical protein